MKKRIISLIGAFVMVMSLCACGGEAAYADASSNEKGTAVATTPQDAPKAGDSGNKDAIPYRDIYAAQIDELVSREQADLFALVYVDDDDVPELAAISSEGSWDKDQVFLYTTDGKKAVLLASDIGPGMEGHSISFFEKQNVFMQSGAALGDSFVFYKIEKSAPVKITSLSWFEMPDADGEYIETYMVDDKEVSEEDYAKALKSAVPKGEMTILVGTETTDMVKYDVDAQDGYLSYEQKDEVPYYQYDEIMLQLKQ